MFRLSTRSLVALMSRPERWSSVRWHSGHLRLAVLKTIRHQAIMLFAQTMLTLFLYATALVTAADTSAWKSRSIYFVLTDRVARSSSDTGGGACGDLGNYCGGTFRGLQSKLDYIQGLGFDAIWITPVVSSTSTNPFSTSNGLITLQTRRMDTMATGLKTSTPSTQTMALQMTSKVLLVPHTPR